MDITGIGLILEGGGMRGVYTAGVLDCLLDQGLYLMDIYGVSAGACHACSYRSRQKGRAVRTVVDFVQDKRYCGIYSLLTTGDFFGVKMIYDEIPNRLVPFDYDTYAATGGFLCAVATDCRTGQADYLRVEDAKRDMVVVRASSSLPMLSRMVEVGGKQYLDGGVSDSIPLAKSIEDGHTKNLVILTQHRGYTKGPNRFSPAAKVRYRRHPQLAESIRTRHYRYNQALKLVEEEERQGRAFVIQPARPVTIGRLEKDDGKLRRLYQEGYEDTARAIPGLREFLEVAPTRPADAAEPPVEAK